MRARFTDSIASTEGWSYGVGTEVLLAGDRYTADAVPEAVGRVWLSTGLLGPVEAVAETATQVASRTAASTPVTPRQRPERFASRR